MSGAFSRERLSPTDPRPSKRTKPPDPPPGQTHQRFSVHREPQGNGYNVSKQMSWKDKVLNREKSKELAYDAQEKVPVDLIEKGIVTREFKEGNPSFPIFHVDPTYMERLEAPWRQSVVVKLLGRSISFRVLYSKIEQLWKPVGGFDLLDIGHDYFLVKFDNGADFDVAMEKGPWLIFDHYLIVRQWTPGFSAVHATVDSSLVWVRFPKVSVQYYDEDLLLALATGIGRPVKVDKNTTLANRGRFARVCVEIELDKPLVGQLEIDGTTYYVEYEGLHTICFKCGKFGHKDNTCPSTLAASGALENNLQAELAAEAKQTMAGDKPITDANLVGNVIGETLGIGSWMVVEKRSKRPPRIKLADLQPKNQCHPSNRYMVLNEDEYVDNELQTCADLGHEQEKQPDFTFKVGSSSGVNKTGRPFRRQEVSSRPKGHTDPEMKSKTPSLINVPDGEFQHQSDDLLTTPRPRNSRSDDSSLNHSLPTLDPNLVLNIASQFRQAFQQSIPPPHSSAILHDGVNKGQMLVVHGHEPPDPGREQIQASDMVPPENVLISQRDKDFVEINPTIEGVDVEMVPSSIA